MLLTLSIEPINLTAEDDAVLYLSIGETLRLFKGDEFFYEILIIGDTLLSITLKLLDG